MPYLPLDLDAKKKAGLIANSLGIHPGHVLWGLMELWEQAWRTKNDIVPEYVLDGCFAGCMTEKLRERLTEAGFAERTDEGWRIRGAKKWLFGMEGRARGGHAAKSNLIPGAIHRRNKPKPAEDPKSGSSAPAEGQPKASRTPPSAEPSALTPSSQHPTPIDSKSKSLSNTPSGGEPKELELELVVERRKPIDEVIAHYVEAIKANGFEARASKEKRKLIETRLKDGFSVEQLKEAINGLTWSDWHMGRDPKTGGQSYHALKYAIGNSERIEANIARAKSPPEEPKRVGGWR